MAKRRSRKRRRSLGARLILILALILLVAGFLTRRMLMPTADHGVHRSNPARLGAAGHPATQPAAAEQLDASDRAELERLIRSKTH